MNVANRVYAQLDFAVSPDMYTFVITKKQRNYDEVGNF